MATDLMKIDNGENKDSTAVSVPLILVPINSPRQFALKYVDKIITPLDKKEKSFANSNILYVALREVKNADHVQSNAKETSVDTSSRFIKDLMAKEKKTRFTKKIIGPSPDCIYTVPMTAEQLMKLRLLHGEENKDWSVNGYVEDKLKDDVPNVAMFVDQQQKKDDFGPLTTKRLRCMLLGSFFIFRKEKSGKIAILAPSALASIACAIMFAEKIHDIDLVWHSVLQENYILVDAQVLGKAFLTVATLARHYWNENDDDFV